MVLLGHDSDNYKSSNERPNKEIRMDMDDPFWLDPLILGSGVNVQRGTSGPLEFDALSSDNHQQHSDNNYSYKKLNGSVHAKDQFDEAVNNIQEEVDETTQMGIRLGAQLSDFQTLVTEAVEIERAQSGFR